MSDMIRIAAFCLGLVLAAGAVPCHAQQPQQGAAAQTGHHRQCHHNAKGELVCRNCWHEHGKVRCGQPSIIAQ